MCVSAWTPFVLLKDRHGATFQRHRVHHFPFTTHPRILKSKPEVQSFHYPPSLPLIKCSTFGQSIQKYSSNDGVVMNREKLNQKDRFNVWRWEFKKKEKKRKERNNVKTGGPAKESDGDLIDCRRLRLRQEPEWARKTASDS